MNNTVTVVCAVVLVITFVSEKCFSLKTSDNVDVQSDDGLSKINSEDSSRVISIRYILNGGKDALDKSNWISKRVTRQAYQGQAPLYPNLSSGPSYGLEPYPNYNNQIVRPEYNNPTGPYGQKPQVNPWQPTGQPNYNNGLYGSTNYTQSGFPNSNEYKPTNFTNNPSGRYGQYPQQNQPNPWQPNGQQPNYNNAYGTNTQSGNNFTQPRYPVSNSYKSSNFSYNPSGLYEQSTPPSSWKNPYANNNGLRSNDSNASNLYPNYNQFPNTYNNPSGRPPYNQPRPSHNNSYLGYPSNTSFKPYPNYPSQRTPYSGQTQINNNTRPGNQHSVVYDDSTKRPGQNPYNSYYNASKWSANTLNNTNGRLSYSPQNGQNPQYFNSYPGSPGYGQQNSTNPYNIQTQRPPYQNPYGQHSPTSYPGQASDSATFNLANSGYKPSIPVRPPYGSPYGNGPYSNISPNNYLQYPNGTSHDPTRVSPQNFNSY